MKKSIIALMGLFTLIACSEDVYQEADKMSETGTVESAGSQNSIKTVDTSIPYESPYGTSGEAGFEYVFKNDTDFEWKFVAWVQLCFFDGTNDNIHFGHNLASYNYFNTFMVWPNWNEYTAQYGTQMFIIPPRTTEIITMNNGKILPVDPAGPTTASGQYFDLETVNMGPMIQKEMDFFGQFLKFVGFEGSVSTVDGLSVANTTLRFPLGPQYSSSPNPGAVWAPVPTLWSPFDEKVCHSGTKEICTTNVFAGSIGGRPSFITFTDGAQTYTASAYTTSNQVVVVLE